MPALVIGFLAATSAGATTYKGSFEFAGAFAGAPFPKLYTGPFTGTFQISHGEIPLGGSLTDVALDAFDLSINGKDWDSSNVTFDIFRNPGGGVFAYIFGGLPSGNNAIIGDTPDFLFSAVYVPQSKSFGSGRCTFKQEIKAGWRKVQYLT